MDRLCACNACGLGAAGAMAAPVCYPCREHDRRRQFCIAFPEGRALRLFIATDDEGAFHSCMRKLEAQGQDSVMLIWNKDERCYLNGG